MGTMQRNKGANGERELFKLLSAELGFAVMRNLSQSRDAGCDSISIPGFAIEVKRQESPFQKAWMEQAILAAGTQNIPVVFYRQSRQPWRMVVRTSDLVGEPAYRGLATLEFADAVVFLRERLRH